MLRRVNDLLPQEYRRRVPYGEVGKRYFAMGILARSDSGTARLAREGRKQLDADPNENGSPR